MTQEEIKKNLNRSIAKKSWSYDQDGVNTTLSFTTLQTASSSLQTPDFLLLRAFTLETCNCKQFSVSMRYKSSPSLLQVLQPKNLFLKDLKTIPLKCNYQERQCLYLPVSVERQEPNFGGRGCFAPSCKTTSGLENKRKCTFPWIRSVSKHRWFMILLTPSQLLKILQPFVLAELGTQTCSVLSLLLLALLLK